MVEIALKQSQLGVARWREDETSQQAGEEQHTAQIASLRVEVSLGSRQERLHRDDRFEIPEDDALAVEGHRVQIRIHARVRHDLRHGLVADLFRGP